MYKLSLRHKLSIVNCQLSIILIAFILSGCSTPAVTEPDTDPVTNLRALWQILDTRYCYFTEHDIDWDQALATYKPRAAKVTTVFGLFNVMQDMLDILNDGHVNLYTPFAVSACTGWYDSYPTDFYSELIFSDRYLSHYNHINYIYYGTIDSVGYLYISSFSASISSVTMQYINFYFRNCKGIIIDVRNNGGGSLDASSELAASLFTERTLTGYMRHKTGSSHDAFSEPQATYTDPADSLVNWSQERVVVLCNRRSYSSTNDFVNAVRYAPNVTIMGGITGGGGGMPLSQELPNGWMVRFSAVPMYDASMHSIDFGITPDIEIHITPEDYAAGRDPILDAAISYIKQ